MDFTIHTIGTVLQENGLFQIVLKPEYRDGLLALVGRSG